MSQSNHELLDHTNLMIDTFKDDRQKLMALHDLLLNHYYVQPKPDLADIPEKYKPVVHEIAEMVSSTIYVVNPETLEFVSFPVVEEYIFPTFEEMEKRILKVEKKSGKDGNIMEELEVDEFEQLYFDEYLKMRDWKHTIEIAPPRSNQSYQLMENFIHTLQTGNLRDVLFDTINRKKPFRHFNAIIHDSPLRQQWFDFRQQELEKYVWSEIKFGLENDD